MNRDRESRGQPANPGLPGNWPLRWFVCMFHVCFRLLSISSASEGDGIVSSSHSKRKRRRFVLTFSVVVP